MSLVEDKPSVTISGEYKEFLVVVRSRPNIGDSISLYHKNNLIPPVHMFVEERSYVLNDDFVDKVQDVSWIYGYCLRNGKRLHKKVCDMLDELHAHPDYPFKKK